MENKGAIIIYQTRDHETRVEVKFEEETVWLTQKQIASVFGTEVPAINKHIKNILKDKELLAEATISKMEIVQKEGKRKISRNVEAYNLDMIISVGYRVNSTRATDFRIWAWRTKHHTRESRDILLPRLTNWRNRSMKTMRLKNENFA